MLGVYASGIAGAHINPAVTFANCVFRKFPWKMFLPYAIAQTLGAMLAAAIVYGNYRSAIDVYEGGAGIRTVPGYSEHATVSYTILEHSLRRSHVIRLVYFVLTLSLLCPLRASSSMSSLLARY